MTHCSRRNQCGNCRYDITTLIRAVKHPHQQSDTDGLLCSSVPTGKKCIAKAAEVCIRCSHNEAHVVDIRYSGVRGLSSALLRVEHAFSWNIDSMGDRMGIRRPTTSRSNMRSYSINVFEVYCNYEYSMRLTRRSEHPARAGCGIVRAPFLLFPTMDLYFDCISF